MNGPWRYRGGLRRQAGLTLVELMVSIAIAMTILSGVVQVLVVSKNNFITERELAALQENARFALKYMTDEVRMAGYTGCMREPSKYANIVQNSSGSWYLDGTGLYGFEHEAGINAFPPEPNGFRNDVAPDTDALVVRRGDNTGLRIVSHASSVIQVNRPHAYQPGQIMLVIEPDCMQMGMFQLSGPANAGNNAQSMEHDAGSGIPGNCTPNLKGVFSFDCLDTTPSAANPYRPGSVVMALRSEAFYVGESEDTSGTGDPVPALFRERMWADAGTTEARTRAEELVQGVENMQLLYGIDTDGDGMANRYVKANYPSMDWSRVVTVRILLQMRSVNPVYNRNEDFPALVGGTVSDRYMRQLVSTTVNVRNL